MGDLVESIVRFKSDFIDGIGCIGNYGGVEPMIDSLGDGSRTLSFFHRPEDGVISPIPYLGVLSFGRDGFSFKYEDSQINVHIADVTKSPEVLKALRDFRDCLQNVLMTEGLNIAAYAFITLALESFPDV